MIFGNVAMIISVGEMEHEAIREMDMRCQTLCVGIFCVFQNFLEGDGAFNVMAVLNTIPNSFNI